MAVMNTSSACAAVHRFTGFIWSRPLITASAAGGMYARAAGDCTLPPTCKSGTCVLTNSHTPMPCVRAPDVMILIKLSTVWLGRRMSFSISGLRMHTRAHAQAAAQPTSRVIRALPEGKLEQGHAESYVGMPKMENSVARWPYSDSGMVKTGTPRNISAITAAQQRAGGSVSMHARRHTWTPCDQALERGRRACQVKV